MKLFIVLALFAAAAVAAPVSDDAAAQIVEQYLENIGVEGYKFGSKTSNGIQAESEGQLKVLSPESAAVVTRGSFSYIGPDGVTYAVTYIADENGFQPQGAHLPVAA